MPVEEPIPRSIRLVHIQTLLYQRPQGLSSRELAQICGVDMRTIQRDMRDLGSPPHSVPIMWQRGRWQLDPDYQPLLPALNLALPEATALFLAARLLVRASDEANPYVTAALAKLASVLPDPIAGHVRATLLASPQHVQDAFVRVFAAVTAAWAARRKVRLWHQSGTSKNLHEYMLSPYFIEPSASSYATYVIGYEEMYFRAVRTFKLERIQRAELTEVGFAIPESFDITAFLTSAWGIMGGGSPVEVVVRFASAATRRVKESLWHPRQRIEDLADGGCMLRVSVSHPIEMVPWLRGWGAAAEVLAPADLRERMAEDAQRLATLYGKAGGQSSEQ